MISYEWDIETVDTDGDILEHDHREALKEFDPDALRAALDPQRPTRLVLVRDVGNEADGLIERHWAYVGDGELPVVFNTELDIATEIRVPKRFHAELRRALTD